MSDFTSWVSDHHDVQVLLLDKGALALLLALVTWAFAVLLERYKSIESAKLDLIRDERVHKKEEQQRLQYARTEFDTQCRFFGPQNGKVITEIHLVARNKGLTLKWFESIEFRLLGLRNTSQLGFYRAKDGTNKLAFRDFYTSETLKQVFTVEPGITHVFPFMTLIDEDISYLLVKVTITPHLAEQPEAPYYTEERFFQVRISPEL